MLRRLARIFAVVLSGLAAAIIAYAGAALFFAFFPERGRLQINAEGEPPVYVCASLAHADILLPAEDVLVDWTSYFPEVASPHLPPGAYLAFGWGDLTFFQETPTWNDVRAATVVAAFAGWHESALRAVAVNKPTGDSECKAVRLDAEGRKALIDHVLATLTKTADGRPQHQTGGGRYEAFYLANGRYSPHRTCNQWVADGLSAAGLPHTRFAPFSFSVMWPLQG